jgi:hypothetical protein
MSYSQPSLVAIIIKIYGLALDDNQVESILVAWFQQYDPAWIIKALIESLYRGRYKLVSVDNILKDWQRIGKPRYNFTPEYEREILQKIPNLFDPTVCDSTSVASITESASPGSIEGSAAESAAAPDCYAPIAVDRAVTLVSQNLNPEESAPFQYHHDSGTFVPTPTPQTVPLADTAAITTHERKLIAERHYVSRAMPSSSGFLQCKIQTRDHCDQHESALVVVQPAKRRLFNTLKAIVDPNNHYAAAEAVVLSPQSLRSHAIGHISQF